LDLASDLDIGHGLTPLSGSIVLEQIDLSSRLATEIVAISVDVVVPILRSIIEATGNRNGAKIKLKR
jgi:hypothetical protein